MEQSGHELGQTHTICCWDLTRKQGFRPPSRPHSLSRTNAMGPVFSDDHKTCPLGPLCLLSPSGGAEPRAGLLQAGVLGWIPVGTPLLPAPRHTEEEGRPGAFCSPHPQRALGTEGGRETSQPQRARSWMTGPGPSRPRAWTTVHLVPRLLFSGCATPPRSVSPTYHVLSHHGVSACHSLCQVQMVT